MKTNNKVGRHVRPRMSQLCGWLLGRGAGLATASTAVPPSKRLRRSAMFLEPLEPRVLLSADGVLGVGATAAIVTDFQRYGDLLQTHIDQQDDYGTRVPGLLLTERDLDLNGSIEADEQVAPALRDLLAVGVEQNGDPGSYTLEETALNLLDDSLINNQVVSWNEAYRGLVVTKVGEFLVSYNGSNLDGDGVAGDADDVEMWVQQHLDALDAAHTFVPSVLSSYLYVTVDTDRVAGDDRFNLWLDVTIAFTDRYRMDLGLAAEAAEIELPRHVFGYDPLGVVQLAHTVSITGQVDAALAVSYDMAASNALMAPTGSVHASVKADGDGSVNLSGERVNVGFLGTTAGAGSSFDLSMEIETRLSDLSSPTLLGFADTDGDAGLAGLIGFAAGSSGGELVAAAAPSLAYNHPVPVQFDLTYTYTTGSYSAPVSVNLASAADADAVRTALESAILSGTELDSLLSVTLVDGKLHLVLAGSNAMPLGFTDGTHASTGTGPYILQAGTGFDFDSNDDAIIDAADAPVVFAAASFLLSVNGTLPRLVTVAASGAGGYTKGQWLTAVNDALSAAGIAGVTAALNEADPDAVKLRLLSASTLEIVDTDLLQLAMGAKTDISAAEVTALDAAGQRERLFTTTADTATDNFVLTLNLNVVDGLDFVPDGTPQLRIDATFDSYDGPFDLAATPPYFSTTEQRFALPMQNTDFQQYLDFNVFGRAEATAMIEQLEGWAQRLEQNVALAGVEIPLLQSVLGEVLDFSDMLHDMLLVDDQDTEAVGDDVGKLLRVVSALNPDSPVPIFFTVQELGAALNKIGVLTLTGSGDYGAYDKEHDDVLFHLGLSHTIADVELPLDFTLPLPPLGNIYSDSSAYLQAVGRLDAVLGLHMGEAGTLDNGTALSTLNNGAGVQTLETLAVTGGAAVERVYGRMGANAFFQVSVGGGAYTDVSLDADLTDDNKTIADLLTDVRTALEATLNSQLEVVQIGDRIALLAKAGVSRFDLVVDPNNAAYTELGLQGGPAQTVSVTSAPVIDPAAGHGGSLTIHLNGDAGTALNFTVGSGNVLGNASVTDLVNDINELIAGTALQGKIVVTRSGSQVVFSAIDKSVYAFSVTASNPAKNFFFTNIADWSDLKAWMRVTAANEPPADSLARFGRLSADAHLNIVINGTSHAVTLDDAVTAGNGALDQLATQLQAAIDAVLDPDAQVQVEVAANRLVIRANSSAVSSLSVTALATDPAVTELGFATTQVAGGLGVTGNRAAPYYYGPTNITSFRVAVVGGAADTGGTPKTVSLAYPAEADKGGPADLLGNATVYDLANDLQRSLNAAFGSASSNPLQVGVDAGRLVFLLKAGAAGLGATSFSILADSASAAEGRAITELKLHAPKAPAAPDPSTITRVANDWDLLIRDRDGTWHGVSLHGDTTVGDVIASINAAATDATAAIGPLSNGLQISDNTGSGSLVVRTVNGSAAAIDLGLYLAGTNTAEQTGGIPSSAGLIVGDTIATLAMIDRVFLRQVDADTPILSATLTITSDNPDTPASETMALEANFGFVAVTATGGGTLTGSVGLGLVADSDNRSSLRELFSAVSQDLNDDGSVDINDFKQVVSLPTFDLSGNFALDVNVVPGGGIDALIADATVGSLSITVTAPGNPFATPDPIAPDVDITWTPGALGDLEQFESIGFDDVLAALKQLADFLDQYAAFGFLNEDIPLIGVNFNELVDLADQFRQAVVDIEGNPAGSVQLLEQKIREEFGLPPGVLTLALADGEDGDSLPGDMLKIKFNLGAAFSESLPIALALPDGLIDGAPLDISLEGQANLHASGNLDAVFTLGVDLNGNLEDAAPVYLYTHESDTRISGALNASANDLSFNAALGPVGVTIADGSASLALAAAFKSADAANTRVLLGDAFAHFDQISFSGSANGVLPVYFPTQSSYIGDLTVNAAFEASPANGLDITAFDVDAPDFDIDFSSFSLFDNLGLLIDATDLFLSGVQDALDGQILGFELPLVGNRLSEGAQFIEDFRAGFIKDLRNLVENAPALAAETVQGFLFDLLNNKFHVLADTNGVGGITLADVIIEGLSTLSDGDASNDYLQWNVLLGKPQALVTGLNVPLDIGFPALGLNADVGLNVQLGWELGIGLGISIADGAYIDVLRQDYTTPADDTRPELELTFDVSLAEGSNLSGDLLFLQLDINEAPRDLDGNGTADPTHFHAAFSVDLMKGEDASTERLAFSEIGSLGTDIDLQTDAAVNLDLTLMFNQELVGSTVSSVLPQLQAHFALLWQWSLSDADSAEFGLSDGLKYIAFEDVGVDLGKFLGDTIGPLVAKIQSVTEPFQPIIDVVTAAIPVLSDLAGEPITLVDLAAAFGEFNPDLIYAISDLITLVNSIPASPGQLILPLGDFVLIDERVSGSEFTFGGTAFDLTDPNFSFAGMDGTAFGSAVNSLGSRLGDVFGSGIEGVLGGLAGNDTVRGVAQSLFGGDYDRTGGDGKEYGFAFPLFEDPSQIFGLLLGRQAAIVTYDLPPFGMDFTWKQSFPIYGPLWGVVTASIGMKIDLAFGYDTQGLMDFYQSGFTNPVALFSGLYIADTDNPAGGGTDVPELVFTGTLGVGAELNLGIASAGVTANIILTANFDLYDPNHDDKIRIDELLSTFMYEVRSGNPALAPLSIFDISAEFALQLKAYIQFLVARFDFEITPPITLFEFSIPFEREPILATERADGSLLLNIGSNAGARMNGDLRDLGEEICVEYIGGNQAKVWSDALGVSEGGAQIYDVDPTKGIFGYGGEGNDIIVVKGDIKLTAEGNSGDDTIVLDASNQIANLRGGVGNDTLVGASGADLIWGEAGDDVIDGRGGADWLFGDFADIRSGAPAVAPSTPLIPGSVRVGITEEDGNDIVWGGAGADIVFGGGGNDAIAGDAGAITGIAVAAFSHCGVTVNFGTGAVNDGAADFLFGDGGRIAATGVDPAAGLDLAPTTVDLVTGRTAFNGISLTDREGGGNDLIEGQGGNDVIFAGAGDDHADGGANNDTIYGETGLDVLSGGADNDQIAGGLGKDLIFGFGAGPADPYNDGGSTAADGADLLFGDDGNDLVRGNGGNDTLYGGRGADVLFGDADNDHIFGENEADTIFGGAGNDYVEGQTGNDTVFGDDGLAIYFKGVEDNYTDDRVIGDAFAFGGTSALFSFYDDGPDTATGDDDSDLTLDLLITYVRSATDGNDTVIGGEGDDIAFGGAGNDNLFGDLDPAQWLVDYASVSPPPVPAGADTLIGDGGKIEWHGRRIDRIESFKGASAADAGDDTITGNGGADRLLGGGGSDTLHGRMAASYADAASAAKLDEDVGVDAGDEVSDDDILIGDDGFVDYARGTTKLVSIASTIYNPLAAETYADKMYGNWGRDIAIGGLGGDELYGDTGLTGNAPRSNDDILIGDNGELLYGSAVIPANFGRLELIQTTDSAENTGGADLLVGSEGNDVALGGVNDGGIDTVTGGLGNDVLLGDNGLLDFAYDTDTDLNTLDLVRSNLDSRGGTDTVSGDQGDDVLVGGTGGDQMYGDNAGATSASADGEDILLGDNADLWLIGSTGRLFVKVGEMTAATAVDRITTTDIAESTGGVDTLSGNARADIMLGGVAGDTMYGDRAVPTSTSINDDGNDILLGDNGELDFTYESDTERQTLDLVRSHQDGRGASDTISGGKGQDVVIGGTAGDTLYGDDATAAAAAFDIGDLLLGDNADIFLVAPAGASGGDLKLVLDAAVKTIRTTDIVHPEYGGADTISGNAGSDIVAGGVQGDTIYGDRASENDTAVRDGDDILLGDNGAFEWQSSGRFSDILGIDIASENPALWAHFASPDTNLTTLDLVTTEQPNSGGRDFIRGDAGRDLVFGGTDADTIYGDDADLEADSTGGNDLLLGDHGRIYIHDSALVNFNSRNFFAIDTGNTHGGEGDRIWGEEGDDVLLGQQGDDRLWGGSGNDDMTGGHNVAGGFDELTAPAIVATLNPPVNDLMDGGSGDDAMAGDNAILWRRGDDVSPRLRELTKAAIYTTTEASITANVETFASRFAGRSDPNDAVGRDITLLDHSDTVQANPQGRFGNDVMAGGADDDQMFGQLGNDLVQGDGNIETALVAPAFIGRTLNVTDSGSNPDTDQVLYFNIPELASDGDDYLEGNGGGDLIYGGLGQDDLIGGSSALYGLDSEAKRPDGGDLIYGGAGIAINRNDIGATSFGLASESITTHDITTVATGHARDADFIVGDNANVYRLVNESIDSFRTFNYDNYGALKVIVRAMEQLDYHLGGADYNPGAYVDGAAMLTGQTADNGAADLVHGESGDDIVFGMTGSDILFGDGQDDDLVGGYGHDWISGGTGRDGVLGDDGLIYTSRNSTTGEALYGVAGLLASDPRPKYADGTVLGEVIKTPGEAQYAVINVEGELKKAIDLVALSYDSAWLAMDDEFPDNQDESPFADDIIFGGLGSDWLHGGSGDDAVSGAEALDAAYVPVYNALGAPVGIRDLGYAAMSPAAIPNPGDALPVPNPGDVLAFNPLDANGQHLDNRFRAGEFALYDEYDPRRKVQLDQNGNLWKSAAQGTAYEFILNFNAAEGVVRPGGTVPKATGQQTESYPAVNDDGADKLFGDLGNDWLVGGSGRDDAFGGWGNDLLNADDNHGTNGSLNDQPDTHPTYEDRAYGGAGRDVLIGNTGGDRLIDWVGEYNSFLVPYAPFGSASVSRTMQPFLPEFLYALSASDGADPTRHADTGADPLRNGEPDGELGLVLQMDFAWQDQTGAPSDPQAGNIPGGPRDVLRTANFNDNTSQGFLTESGVWSVKGGVLSVQPTSIGTDAVTLWLHDQPLPSYFEVTATVNPVKPVAGYKANSYIVFDYYSPTDFKFAGLDSSTNKIEIGQRTASGWQVLASSNMQIKPDSNYNLLVAFNGNTASIQVNNGAVLSHAFAPRIDAYGISHHIGEGMLGLGADNAKASIDNLSLLVLPPAITLTRTDGYSSSPALTQGAQANWSVSGGRYLGQPTAGQPFTLASGSLDVGSFYVLQLEAKLQTQYTGGIVFDRYSDSDFKWAGIDKASGKVLLGHYSARTGWIVDAQVAKTWAAGDATLSVTLKGSTVSVLLNGQAALSYAYNALVTDGGYGLIAKGGLASFDSFTLRTDDPAFAGDPGGVLSLQASEAATADATAQSITLGDLQDLRAEALHRWSYSVDEATLQKMVSAEFAVTDLPGLGLGEYRDGTIFVDIDAAGHGWFVDPTPWSDNEYAPIDGMWMADRGPAASQMDLLSVVAHELGHGGGLPHASQGAMDATLAVGMRNAPPHTLEPDALPPVAAAGATADGYPAMIDWAPANPVDLPALAAAAPSTATSWANDFVNHLGRNAVERNPNASLRIHLPVVNEVIPETDLI